MPGCTCIIYLVSHYKIVRAEGGKKSEAHGGVIYFSVVDKFRLRIFARLEAAVANGTRFHQRLIRDH